MLTRRSKTLTSFLALLLAYRSSAHIFNLDGHLNVNLDATILEISINIFLAALLSM